MNVLLSCSGKQVNMVRWFKASVGKSSVIIASDSNKYSPSLIVADRGVIAPSVTEAEYRGWMVDFCKSNSVGLLVSFYEQDLILLESIRKELLSIGCILVGAEPAFVQGITNKWLAKPLIEEAGLLYPPTALLSEFKGNEFEGPYIVKPCLGRGSRGIERAETVDRVSTISESLKNPDDFIVQKIICGDLYCFDIVNNLDRQYQCALIRRRLRMGAEETEVAVTTQNSKIEEVARQLSFHSKHQGSIDVEAIENEDGVFLIDVNMRFGGSYAFSHAAGANVPGAIVSWAAGHIPPSSFLSHKVDVVGAKFNSVQRLNVS